MTMIAEHLPLSLAKLSFASNCPGSLSRPLHDGAGMAKDYAPDFDHVSVMGQWTHGREPMEKLYVRESAPGGRFTGGTTRTSQIQQIKFVRPDVAIAITKSKDEKNHLRSTYVLTKEGPRWLILASQRSFALLEVTLLGGCGNLARIRQIRVRATSRSAAMRITCRPRSLSPP